jgi:hypothetical protein
MLLLVRKVRGASAGLGSRTRGQNAERARVVCSLFDGSDTALCMVHFLLLLEFCSGLAGAMRLVRIPARSRVRHRHDDDGSSGSGECGGLVTQSSVPVFGGGLFH